MRILVTGSQGTLGKPLAAELIKRGHSVTGADLIHAPGDIRTDVGEARQVERTFKALQPDVCYHLAGEFGRVNGQNYYEQLWKTNCLGTRNVIESCLKHNTRLIFASSSEAYGSLADTGILNESRLDNEVPSFHNEYALSKWTGEQQIRTAIKNDGLQATILRFFNVYGPGERYSDYRSVICLFIYRCLHNLPVTVYTKTHRSFLYVDDWAEAVANLPGMCLPGQALNIGGSFQWNLLDVFNLIARLTNYTMLPHLIENEQSNICDKRADLGRAKTLIGLRDSVILTEGIARTITWMRREYGK